MKTTWILILLLAAALLLAVSMPQAGANKENSVNAPVYTADGSLKLPANYREWVYLSSGLDMSYSPNASPTTGTPTPGNSRGASGFRLPYTPVRSRCSLYLHPLAACLPPATKPLPKEGSRST